MSEKTTCTYCGAIVLWVLTENGKQMPVDAQPVRRFVLDGARKPMTARLRNTYACHLETCSRAKGRGDAA